MAIKTSLPEIVPITDEEMASILKACHKPRTRALILLMRWTGLRIRDAVTIRKDQVQDGRIVLRTAKTGQMVTCLLPDFVLSALQEIDGAGEFYFWNGVSRPKSAVGVYQKILQRVFDKAETGRIYPHLFRHTFATNLLSAGASIETVQEFLGHASVKVTERHYKHWIKNRQDRADIEVKRSWPKKRGHSLGTVSRRRG